MRILHDECHSDIDLLRETGQLDKEVFSLRSSYEKLVIIVCSLVAFSRRHKGGTDDGWMFGAILD